MYATMRSKRANVIASMTIRRQRRRLDATTTIASNQCNTKHKIDYDNKHDDDNDDDDDDVGERSVFVEVTLIRTRG